MTYCLSDIHGEILKWQDMLKLIQFSDEDTMYVLGDVIDRNPHGIEILQDIMKRPNIHMIIGNHEDMIEKCKAGKIDLVMIHDLSRLSKDCLHLMKNTEPLTQCQPEIGILSFRDQLLFMAPDAACWAEKMASGDYSACRLPYFVGFMPLPPDHCEI